MKNLLLLTVALSAPIAAAHEADDPLTRPITFKGVEQLLTPQPPVKIWGNTYYVGFGRLSVVLIKTEAGLVLIDGALPQTVATIEANIRQLGYRIEDVKYILNSEAHFDHSAGLAALSRDSGATVLASASGAKALRAGRSGPDDPQYGGLADIPKVKKLRVVRDGEKIRIGEMTITAHATPGHTPGSTSWTWQSCENGRCLNVVYAASLNPISNGTYTFGGKPEAIFRTSIAKVANLPCDVLISSHPDNSGADEKLKQLASNPDAFVGSNACRSFAAKYEQLLDARLAKERGN
jgi:metallo-beta-lactamase class B